MITTILLLAVIQPFLFGAILHVVHIRAFRRGFRHAVDFLEGDATELAPEIVTWRGALYAINPRSYEDTPHYD